MVHIIPLFVGERRLDTGNAVQYPDSSPVGEAMQQFGDRWQAAAERYEQRKAQQEAFDTEIAARRLNGELAQAEADAVANAPADGAGLHDAMYGQVDPYTGQVVKTGVFDALFGNFLKQLPPELRAGLAARKEALRAVGGRRMAAQQNQRRKQYEQDQAAEVHTAVLSNIAQSDPNDTTAFDASRQAGLDLIAKMDLDPRAKALAEADWLARTAKERLQALIALDPRRAAELLSAGPVASDGMGETVRAQLGAVARDEKAAATGQKTPDEMVAQAFGERPSPDSDTAIPLDAITYLKPGDIAALKTQANNATAVQMIGANARVMLAEQSAPSVIAATGKYPEEEPTAQDFVQVYGADLGPERFKLFRVNTGIGKAYSDMHAASNQAISAELLHCRPGPGGSLEARKRYEVKAGAAQLIMAARAADPVAYASGVFRGDAPDWSKVKTPEELQAAVVWARAAQLRLGFSTVLAVPQEFSDDLGARYVDDSVPLQPRIIELSDKLKALRDPETRFAFAGQVFQSALARLRQKASDDPKITPAELEAQGKALQANLIEMAAHPARVRFDAGSWWQKPFVAANDTVRLMANGATFGQADTIAAGLNAIFSDKSYAELRAAEQAETEDAEDRAGSAAIGANLLGAFLTGQGFQKAGLTFTGRLGAETLEGFPGFLARSTTAAADGAVFGGVDAALNGRDIVREMGAGAILGTGANALAEGIGAIGRRVVARIADRPADAKSSFGTDVKIDGASPYLADPRTNENSAIPRDAGEASIGSEGATNGSDRPDLHLFYMPHWTAAQRLAADLKVAALNAVEKIVTPSVRAPTSASARYKAEGNEVPIGHDVDHVHDLQLGGAEATHNMAPLDSSVNRSLGPQIYHRIKHLPHGTRIGKVTIGDR
ncbi:hypothetical protein [Mesorhizobium sp.]|uniref:hypothetical protein n=1 Tax=Mesorhizobium sp. TaxID=1871066 RepID=UPI0025D60C46|nr:hypothetical protein [Mesorhizobium sp.]